jgi:signal transduction histidine kinase
MVFDREGYLRPFRITLSPAWLRERLLQYYDAVFASRRRVLAANMISGFLIAASVYLLGLTTAFDTFLGTVISFLAMLRSQAEQVRIAPTPLWRDLILIALIITGTAVACTFIRSMKRLLAVNAAIIAAIITLGMATAAVPWSSIVVVLLITIGAILDYYVESRFLRRQSDIVESKQQSEFGILRHITHSVTPTIQMALSPLISLREHLDATGQSGEIIARRRDGAPETAGVALETATVSLAQMRDILTETENIFGNRLADRDFEDLGIRELFAHDINPLFTEASFEIQVLPNGVERMRLHRTSFVQAILNIVRNAEMHAFPASCPVPGRRFIRFEFTDTVKDVIIDYTNNGAPFPQGFRTEDFLAFGKKGKQSTGKGLGGAWVEKFVELHNGRFRILATDPVHFRITLPKRIVT